MLKGQKIGELRGIYIVCKMCSNTIYIHPKDIGKNVRKTCSLKCKYKYIKETKGVDKNCKFCRTKFHIAKISEGQQYCSRDCYFKHIHSGNRKGSNYKGGKYLECNFCRNKFYVAPYDFGRKYCSSKCYWIDPQSPNKQFGKDNPMANPIHKATVRKSVLKHIKKIRKENGHCFRTMIGKNETKILNQISREKEINIIRQYEVEGYFVDGYDKDNNIVYEVDEAFHKNPEAVIRDKQRQEFIVNILQCRFIRIDEEEWLKK